MKFGRKIGYTYTIFKVVYELISLIGGRVVEM